MIPEVTATWQELLATAKEAYKHGKIDEAMKALDAALVHAHQENAPDGSVGEIFFNLGMCHQFVHDYELAEKRYRQALRTAERCFGVSSEAVSTVQRQMLALYQGTNQADKASEIQGQLEARGALQANADSPDASPSVQPESSAPSLQAKSEAETESNSSHQGLDLQALAGAHAQYVSAFRESDDPLTASVNVNVPGTATEPADAPDTKTEPMDARVPGTMEPADMSARAASAANASTQPDQTESAPLRPRRRVFGLDDSRAESPSATAKSAPPPATGSAAPPQRSASQQEGNGATADSLSCRTSDYERQVANAPSVEDIRHFDVDAFVHPREKSYGMFCAIVSCMFYFGLVICLIGILLIPLVYLFGYLLTCVVHGILRSHAIRISPDQFPEVYEIAEELCAEMGMPVPEMFILQEHGLLNAYATRAHRKDILVIYSDVFEMAYRHGRNEMSFILAHELTHVKRGHVKLSWLRTPAHFIPFLGNAYSRACEYTCDKVATQLVPQGALYGLVSLASGTKLYRQINLEALRQQQEKDWDFWTWYAEVLSTHPNLVNRIAAVGLYNGGTSELSPSFPHRHK